VTHFHFTCGPVDFGVVLPEPTEAKNHLTLAQSGNCELGSLSVVIESQDYIDDIVNFSLFIGSSIHIIHRNSLFQ